MNLLYELSNNLPLLLDLLTFRYLFFIISYQPLISMNLIFHFQNSYFQNPTLLTLFFIFTNKVIQMNVSSHQDYLGGWLGG